MTATLPPCSLCGHAEALHHPTRTETWCIKGIADINACSCPGYNPNSKLRVDQWVKEQRRAAIRDLAAAVPVTLWAVFGGISLKTAEAFKSWIQEKAERI